MISPEEIKFAPPEVQAEYAQETKEEQETPELKVEAQSTETDQTSETEQKTAAADSERNPVISFYQRMAEKSFHFPDFDTEKLEKFGNAIIEASKKAVSALAKVWNSDLLLNLQKGKEDKLAMRLSEKENALNELNSKHEDFQRRMALIAEKIGSVDPKIDAEIEKENQKFEKEKQNLLKEKEQANSKLESHLRRFSNFETNRDSMLDAYVDRVEEQLAPIEQKIQEQEQKLETAESDLAQMRDAINNASAKITELEALLGGAEYKAEIASYEQEINRLRKSIVEKADQYNKQEQLRDRIVDSLISYEDRRDGLKQKIDNVRVKKVETGAVKVENDQARPASLFEQLTERPYSLNVEPQEASETEVEKKREIQEKIEIAIQFWNKKNGMRLKLDNKIASQLLAELPNDQSLDAEKTFEKVLILYHRGIVRKKIKGISAFANEGDLRRAIKKFSKEVYT